MKWKLGLCETTEVALYTEPSSAKKPMKNGHSGLIPRAIQYTAAQIASCLITLNPGNTWMLAYDGKAAESVWKQFRRRAMKRMKELQQTNGILEHTSQAYAPVECSVHCSENEDMSFLAMAQTQPLNVKERRPQPLNPLLLILRTYQPHKWRCSVIPMYP